MKEEKISKLKKRKKYLQIALNSTLEEAVKIITNLPRNERIIIEAGTPFIKKYGQQGIKFIKDFYQAHLLGLKMDQQNEAFETIQFKNDLKNLIKLISWFKDKTTKKSEIENVLIQAYVVADLKTMDRGETEVILAAEAGADAATALGHAPIETLNSFVESCQKHGLDSMIDMMNVENSLTILKSLKRPPKVVILHRGVDEENFNKTKQIPLHEIQRIKGSMETLVAVAGGDTIREVQRAIFNDADIVIVWKEFYHSHEKTGELAKDFLEEIK